VPALDAAWPYFVPAREFYKRHRVVECPLFSSFVRDPNSEFMTLELR
jgi:putative acetyltransferase